MKIGKYIDIYVNFMYIAWLHKNVNINFNYVLNDLCTIRIYIIDKT